FVYYKGKITAIKLEIAQKEGGKKLAAPLKIITEEKTSRDEKIYADILLLFDQKAPYCNHNYTIADLAVSLNTNVRYVSEALKRHDNQNFNNFINGFRIRFIKEMLNSDLEKKYTIQHIYTSAGFRNQSTFNKAYRHLEGITPTEYIAQMENLKKNRTNNSAFMGNEILK
ncbi:MAG: helix-turn-helix domain-containing protein, partial [Tannerella sp.]|nr:helix-turn-helix domain-containing protein [Tannerella sp.]